MLEPTPVSELSLHWGSTTHRCLYMLAVINVVIIYYFVRDIDSLLHTKQAKAEVSVPEVSMDEGSESEAEPMTHEEEDENQPKVTLLVSSNFQVQYTKRP